MTKNARIGFLVCTNGLGHFRRSLQVALHMLYFNSQKMQLEIFCADWQMKTLRNWFIFRTLKNHPHVKFISYEPHVRWDTRASYVNDTQILNWSEKVLEPLRLHEYDLLISDNFVEALRYKKDAVLMASFLWHELYTKQFPESPLWKNYQSQCQKLLHDTGAAMIANQYFAMPSVRSETQMIGVGMLPPIVHFEGRDNDGLMGILYSRGSNAEVYESLKTHLENLDSQSQWKDRFEIFVDRPLFESLKSNQHLKVFDYDLDSFDRIDAVVGRPGMGTITECLGTATPLYCLHEDNWEMEFNCQRLEDLGVGWKIRDLATLHSQIEAFYQQPGAAESYRQRVFNLNSKGLDETIKFLSDRLEGRKLA